MKLDKRPLTQLTLDIIRSTSMWMLVYRDGSGSVCHASLLADAFPFDHDLPTTCYPCKAEAPFEPIPWPLLPGEEEIEDWQHYHPDEYYAHRLTGSPCWWLCREHLGIATIRLDARHGLRPSPRRRINSDGTVWVWEADR